MDAGRPARPSGTSCDTDAKANTALWLPRWPAPAQPCQSLNTLRHGEWWTQQGHLKNMHHGGTGGRNLHLCL